MEGSSGHKRDHFRFTTRVRFSRALLPAHNAYTLAHPHKWRSYDVFGMSIVLPDGQPVTNQICIKRRALP